MKRRGAIKAFLLTPMVFTWPSWAQQWSSAEVSGFAGVFNEEELKLLSAITDTVIPSNGSVGALSTATDKFLARLISDCFEAEFQQEFKEQLRGLDSKSHNQFDKAYLELPQAQREQLLLAMEGSADEDEQSFFTFTKAQIIRGFQTSEVVMVEYNGYSMMPGFYDGDVDFVANAGALK